VLFHGGHFSLATPIALRTDLNLISYRLVSRHRRRQDGQALPQSQKMNYTMAAVAQHAYNFEALTA
jgi:hypothetical protein